MRIWSLHPKYLDTKGLVALWRESLLAKNVLENKTRGYKNHPQLLRFRESEHPLDSINHYLTVVYNEAVTRNYNFNKDKIGIPGNDCRIPVTSGQLHYEFDHLMAKIKKRDYERFRNITNIKDPEPHPLFFVIDGGVEIWEIMKELND